MIYYGQGVGPYTRESKKLEQEIAEHVKKVNEKTGMCLSIGTKIKWVEFDVLCVQE